MWEYLGIAIQTPGGWEKMRRHKKLFNLDKGGFFLNSMVTEEKKRRWVATSWRTGIFYVSHMLFCVPKYVCVYTFDSFPGSKRLIDGSIFFPGRGAGELGGGGCGYCNWHPQSYQMVRACRYFLIASEINHTTHSRQDLNHWYRGHVDCLRSSRSATSWKQKKKP